MSINHRSYSEQLHCPRIPIKEIGLKEWAIVIEALEKGEQLILVRKDGLIEETKDFRLEDTSFYLYPVFEQQNEQLIKESYRLSSKLIHTDPSNYRSEVPIRCVAHVTDEIELFDTHVLKKLSSFHVFKDEYLTMHLQWKKSKPLHVLIIRAYRLNREISIPILDQHSSCSAWINLESKIENADCVPIVEDYEFSEKRLNILRQIGIVDDKK